jgi:hypothetical protein
MCKISVRMLIIIFMAGSLAAKSFPGGTKGEQTRSTTHSALNNEFSGREEEPSTKSGEPTLSSEHTQLRVTVYDSVENVPIELARVALSQNGVYVVNGATNPAGVVRFRDIDVGTYRITAWYVGYETFSDTISIDPEHSTYKVLLHPQGNTEKEVVVVGQREALAPHIDRVSGNQVFESETFHAPPTVRMTSLIQENMMGAVRAPTGEVHINGMHGEFTYYVDGIPVPLGVFGGLNEVVDPKAIARATFITGGFPAEYGGQMAAIIDLNNRVPSGQFHLDASTYGGSYLVSTDTLGSRVGAFRALNSNGQDLAISNHIGKLGYFISGSRQETDRRIDQPVPQLFNDHGFDYFLYGKFDYVLSDVDYLTANLNVGNTTTQVPYDPVEAIAADQQKTTNSFQTLSYFRALNSEIDRESNLFVGIFGREGGLLYTPGSIDPPNFQFQGDTTNSYLLTENRSFNTLGMRTTFDKRFSHEFMYKIGLNFSSTSGTEKFTSRGAGNIAGPSIITPFTGSDFGMFGETQWHPMEWTSFEVGARYDQHIAPDIPLQSQISPRIRWNFLIDDFNSAYLYYGKLFMPTNIEGLRSIAVNVSSSLTPTLPERDNFYEAVFIHNFPFGMTAKLQGYYKIAAPGLDDQTVGNSAIKTPVNIETVHLSALNLGFSYSSLETPFSGYVNLSVIHAYGSGIVSGGFLDYDNDGTATDLDHDQRLSIVTGLNYQPENWFANLVAIYGSGLANGNPDFTDFKTGLFDFNQPAHTTPSWIFNFAFGYTFQLGGGSTFVPSLYVTNILNNEHLIKGAYFSGASWEEPRNVVVKLAYHI